MLLIIFQLCSQTLSMTRVLSALPRSGCVLYEREASGPRTVPAIVVSALALLFTLSLKVNEVSFLILLFSLVDVLLVFLAVI